MMKENNNITKNVLVNEMIENIQGLAHECLAFTNSMGMENRYNALPIFKKGY